MINPVDGLDYTETSKSFNFIGDSVQTVSIQIIDDGISEPPETFFGQLSSADGMVIPPNVRLEPNRATATIINENGIYYRTYYQNCAIVMRELLFVQISLLSLQRIIAALSQC